MLNRHERQAPSLPANGGISFPHPQLLSPPSLPANAAGAVTDTYEYDAWGNKINSTGTTPNSYLYRAEQYDSDLGLYYLRARYYNPTTGRFLSRDPEAGNAFDPRKLHKYLYADGDPVNAVDPNGREATIETIFTTTVISSPLELAVESVAGAVIEVLCGAAKLLTYASQNIPPGFPFPGGIPRWPWPPIAALCNRYGL